ncbi:phospholipid scramblase 1-like [Physella acuta]|uniref:phospholipid scramblase 1-like n=1 Tax=Physella acuta TaxID=109671 RepID=UPI0027DD9FDC|nr:phospholipid scramblase 1-like [Physella acuta]
MDHDLTPLLEIVGPTCECTVCCPSIQFEVSRIGDRKPIGVISKYRGDFVKEFFTDADTFGVTFPIDLDVRLKATLIGCVFLIDFMYFEDPANMNMRSSSHRRTRSLNQTSTREELGL